MGFDKDVALGAVKAGFSPGSWPVSARSRMLRAREGIQAMCLAYTYSHWIFVAAECRSAGKPLQQACQTVDMRGLP